MLTPDLSVDIYMCIYIYGSPVRLCEAHFYISTKSHRIQNGYFNLRDVGRFQDYVYEAIGAIHVITCV